jgi:pSer/pThr/pTyr-binding forkhead associated (FHA) protein
MVPPQVAQVAPGAGGWELAQVAPEPARAADSLACPRCRTMNGRHMRFCVGCGQRLAGDDAPAPIAAAPIAAQIAAVPVAVVQPSPPAAAAALPPGVTVCWRCRGAGDPGAAFCKFCGARYEDAARAIAGPGPVAQPPQPMQAPMPQPMQAPMPQPMQAPMPQPMQAPMPQPMQAPMPQPMPAPQPIAAPPPAHAAPAPGALPSATPWPGSPVVPVVAHAAAPVQPTAPGGAPIPHVASAAGDPIAALVAILKDGSDGRSFPIYTEQADIGRTEGDIVLSDDPYLSPRHARLRRRGDGWLLRDLDSANGIYVRIREPVDLADGDMILLGQQVLRFALLEDGELPLGPATQHGVLMFGTPEVPRMARLTQYTTEGVGRDVHYVYRDETVLGRENGDIVFTDDPFLSRRHAAITADRMSRRFVLRDLGSSNGTAVRFHGERSLAAGDQFRVGRHLFRFELAAGPGGRAAR